jgi:hypothetical protein
MPSRTAHDMTGQSENNEVRVSKGDAHRRAIEDYSQYSQFARASAQFAFAANGGAALAMLSFLTAISTAKNVSDKIPITAVTHSFAYAASFYLLGLLLSILAMYVVSISKEFWGHFWEQIALCNREEQQIFVNFRHPYALEGEAYNKRGFRLLFLSALAFVPGCYFAVSAFIWN